MRPHKVSLLRRGSFSRETASKRGKERENKEIKNRGRWEGRVPRKAPARIRISPLPIPQPTGKTKETSAEENVTRPKQMSIAEGQDMAVCMLQVMARPSVG